MSEQPFVVPPLNVTALLPGAGLGEKLRIPPDKSLSHRALMFAALVKNGGEVFNCLRSEDCLSTLGILRALGTAAEEMPLLSGQSSSAMNLHLRGPGLAAWPRSVAAPLDAGNSGTTARLMTGLLAGAGICATLTGDESLSRRPMERVCDPLREMGAVISTTQGCLPLRIEQGVSGPLKNFTLPVASAQVKSALLLAGLASAQAVEIHEPELSRDHTERWLSRLVPGHFSISHDGTPRRTLHLGAGAVLPLSLPPFTVPADPSSAAFWCVLAALAPGAELVIQNVCLNPTRTGFLNVLKRAGVGVEVRLSDDVAAPEPVGDITVRHAENLRPFVIEPHEAPSLIDEAPILMSLAATLPGTSTMRGAAELRKKESDRIACVVQNLRRLGAAVEEYEDGMAVTGAPVLKATGVLTTHHDHRLAMSWLVLAATRGPGAEIDNVACAAVSYPTFLEELPF